MYEIVIETTDFEDAVSRGFSAGNYANAYESQDLATALEIQGVTMEAFRAAFILGFFSSYALDEIGDREEYDAAYFSKAGRRVIKAGYCDDRAEEYAAEERELQR